MCVSRRPSPHGVRGGATGGAGGGGGGVGGRKKGLLLLIEL